ncbi:MAG: cupin domain-containing protein [Clostridium sp.]
MKEIEIVKSNENYTIGNLGEFKDLIEYSYHHDVIDIPIPGKVFVGEKLNTTSVEISFQVLGAGKGIPFDHRHTENEEVYIVLKGIGEFIIDDEVTEVSEGSIIRVATQSKRRWTNTSQSDFIVMVIQGLEGSLNNFTVTDGRM